MKLIQKLSDMIEEEIHDAEKYAKCALELKEDRPLLADAFYKLSMEELVHMNILQTNVVNLIDEYRKTKGEPPEGMMTIYKIFHQKHIENTAIVKGMLSLYKGDK